MSFRTFRHELPAGKNFNGKKPNVSPSVDESKELETYASDANAGLFTFDEKVRSRLRRVVLNIADATTWSLSIRSRSVSVELYNETSNPGSTVYVSGEELAMIDRGDELILVSDGATQAMSAEVTIEEF
jgi:hypothetical protein